MGITIIETKKFNELKSIINTTTNEFKLTPINGLYEVTIFYD